MTGFGTGTNHILEIKAAVCHCIEDRYCLLSAQNPLTNCGVPRLGQTEYENLAAFRYLLRKFLRFSREYLKDTANLNPEQYEALLAIKSLSAKGGVRIADLSERLQVKHHSGVNIVDRLVERKLVRRETALRDRRERHLELTAAGSGLLEKLAAVHRRELRRRSEDMIDALERLRR